MVPLKNSYTDLPERFYERIRPEKFPNPELVLFNTDLADELGLKFSSETDLAHIFSGQDLLPGSDPIAQAYAGYQFGRPVDQLGDGRAHLLGEINGYGLQLKGSGRTRFSRGGDGRSALGPVIREFLVSEAMYALGVPTTRALAIVTTGERVLRQDGPEPGGIMTRVAESYLRIGTFQYFWFRNDREALEILTDYTIRRHYPQIQSQSLSERCLELLKLFAERQGDLVAQWYSLGFIHGVMNTDNCSLAGITIDYGPCAFLDEYRFKKVFSSIDRTGRYAYGNQMQIVEWNIFRLADCLLSLIDDDQKVAVSKVTEALQEVLLDFPQKFFLAFAKKLGLGHLQDGDETLVREFLDYLESESLDFTLSFSHLDELYSGDSSFYPQSAKLQSFLDKWKERQPDLRQIKNTNPTIIPRNHQVQRVIDHAESQDYEPLIEMFEALKSPFEVAEQHRYLINPPQESERVFQTFCGT